MNKLNWRYCECGCRCLYINVDRIYLSVFDDLRGKFDLMLGHGLIGERLGTFPSFREADKIAHGVLLTEADKAKKELERGLIAALRN